MKARPARGGGFLFLERLEVDVQLSVPSVGLSPTISISARHQQGGALGAAVLLPAVGWGQQALPEDQRASFFDRIGCDLQTASCCC